MLRLFDLLVRLYPAEYRAEFGDEMRAVFLALARSRNRESWLRRGWFAWAEYLGLIGGAASERWHIFVERSRSFWRPVASMGAGAVFAGGTHILMYWSLVPGKGRGLGRALEHLVSRIFVLVVLTGIAFGQQQATQDPAALEIVKSIYRSQMTGLRQAKTMDDMRVLAGKLDSPDWISVDRFGRIALTRRDADQELQSVLALPPERRVSEMDILWAERDSDRLIVVAWVMPNQVERVDSKGEFGPKGAGHRLNRGTLVRDIFQTTGDSWRRIRHDKLIPNDTVLAVDGVPRIVPPLDEQHRVKPFK